MTMTNKKLALLAVVALGMLILTVVLYSGEKKPAGDFVSGTPLVQGLAPEKVHSIRIRKGDSTITLERKDDTFVLVEEQMYPVVPQMVNEVVLKCMDIACADKVTSSAANHAGLGVTEDSPDATVISFLDEEKKPLIGLVIGKAAEKVRGHYVRLMGDDTVYLGDPMPRVDVDPMRYIENTPLDVKKGEIASMAVQIGKDAYTLAPDASGEPQLQIVPEGKAAKSSECGRVYGALSPLRIKDVAGKDVADLQWDGVYTCRMKNGVVYTVRTAKKETRYYAKLSASGASAANLPANPAAKAVQDFNALHDGWVYELGGMNGASLRKTQDELLQDATPEGAEAPEEISAQHILIGYQGAAMSEATRTKEEANALAEEVLQKVRAPGADFGELARQYSEGPSAPQGGDLSSFKKEQMAPTFSEAAFALKVGEVSDVVETPFGFHVIKRTK
jgi:hypothetical protein